MARNSSARNAKVQQEKGSKTSMKMPLGKAFKTLRMKRKLTQTELARMIPESVTQGYISQLESGEVFPGRERLGLLLQALQCTASEVWGLAESLARGDLKTADREELLSCLAHEQFNHSYEQLAAFHAAAEFPEEMTAVMDKLSVREDGSSVREEDLLVFRGLCDSVRIPPVYRKALYLLCDYVETYGVGRSSAGVGV